MKFKQYTVQQKCTVQQKVAVHWKCVLPKVCTVTTLEVAKWVVNFCRR